MTPSVSVEEVYAILKHTIEASAPEEYLPLRNACGRFLLEDIAAPTDIPLFTNSAMDGFAFSHESMQTDTVELSVCGSAYAGAPYNDSVPLGYAVRIMTGAPLPEACDTVIPFEKVHQEESRIRFPIQSVREGANIRRQGEELRGGEIVLRKGTQLTPEAIGLLATFGLSSIKCSTLRIGVFSTGDELREPGEPLAPGQIWASNGYLLEALLAQWGYDVVPLGILPDNEAILENAIRSAMQDCDVLVTTGGVGAGDHDQISRVLGRLGNIEHLHVRMRPGRPIAFGYLDAPRPVFFMGLPGNPVAAAVSARIFLARALRLMHGLTGEHLTYIPVTTTTAIRTKTGRTDFIRGTLHVDQQNRRTCFTASIHQSSAMLSSLIRSDALLVIPEGIDQLPAEADGTAILL